MALLPGLLGVWWGRYLKAARPLVYNGIDHGGSEETREEEKTRNAHEAIPESTGV
ncbi:hypothetical protein [Pseudarthrobacter sp. S9]|uniref:hypothetical protein n=1 Tax=Pseudarthrobacter sp. S9 TaxID=3418421 RepID=UPI003D078A31